MTPDDRRFDPQRMHALTNAERRARWNPAGFLKRFEIGPAAAVLDLGSGPGFWTLSLAERVGPQGVVWALDVSQEMLDELAKHNPPPQVRLLHSELPQIKLPDASIDWIWTAFVFHEVTPPAELAREMMRVARARGGVAVLDWRPDAEGESGPPRHHRLSVEQITQFMHGAGFRSVEQTWQDDDAYLVEARK